MRQLKKLSTPQKIQDFLDTLPFNFEKGGDTYMSPKRVLKENKAHCIEGAMLAATALWMHGEQPLLLDLKAHPGDMDHVVALYKQNGYWGAISKTNHAVLRFRDPIYKTVRELALSYFHEYFLNTTGKKTLRGYSKPLNLKKFGKEWITTEKDLWIIADALDNTKHFPFIPEKNKKSIRNAVKIEREAGSIIEWPEK
ncbi:MAG: hypothetical protein WC629_00940 [Candidatus Paceibacterota bacterium]|jgi:hypothetical protein